MLRRYVTAYLGAGLAIGVLDAAWLTATNAVVYRAAVGPLLAPNFRPAPALAFYAVYLIGVVVFAVAPALEAARLRDAVWRGALLGACCYATYDLTNQATLTVWPTTLSAIDIAWGAVLTAGGAIAGYFAARGASKT